MPTYTNSYILSCKDNITTWTTDPQIAATVIESTKIAALSDLGARLSSHWIFLLLGISQLFSSLK